MAARPGDTPVNVVGLAARQTIVVRPSRAAGTIMSFPAKIAASTPASPGGTENQEDSR